MYQLEKNILCADLINEIFLDYLDNINNRGFIIIINDKIKYANMYFLKHTGYEIYNIINKSFKNIVPEYDYDEVEIILHQLNYDKYSQQISIKCINGDVLFFKINGKNFYQDGIKLMFLKLTLLNSLDIENTNTDQQLYHSVLNSVLENIFVIDKDLYIKKTIIIKTDKFSNAHSLCDFFTSTAIKQIKKNIDRKWQEGDSRYFEIQNFKSFFEGRLVPYKQDSFVFAFSEISLRKKIENKLVDSQIQLRQLNNEKDLLLSIIAHDLKNPFNIINGFCSVLLNSTRGFSEQKKEEIIKHIYTASISGYSLLENLLEWSHTQSERVIFSPQEISLKEISDHIINFYSINIVNKKLIIDNKISKDIIVFADKNMLSTILRNLISNAIKFTPEGGVIDLESFNTNDGFIKVCIKDSGVGLSDKQISNLFEIGRNHSTNGTQGEKGTGLGLILCKEFIEKHRGKIHVNSIKEKGSEFFFTIPISNNINNIDS